MCWDSIFLECSYSVQRKQKWNKKLNHIRIHSNSCSGLVYNPFKMISFHFGMHMLYASSVFDMLTINAFTIYDELIDELWVIQQIESIVVIRTIFIFILYHWFCFRSSPSIIFHSFHLFFPSAQRILIPELHV